MGNTLIREINNLNDNLIRNLNINVIDEISFNSNPNCFIIGKYNLDLSNVSFAIGNGSGSSDASRNNLLQLDNNSNLKIRNSCTNDMWGMYNLVFGSNCINYSYNGYSIIFGRNCTNYSAVNFNYIMGSECTNSSGYSYSYLLGQSLTGQNSNCLVIGKYNSIPSTSTAFIFGGENSTTPSNILTLDYNGNLSIHGVY